MVMGSQYPQDVTTTSDTPALQQLADTTQWLPKGYDLVTREDIFSRGLLIIREGSPVSAQLLPKLMRHGAKPQQFILRHQPASFPGQTQESFEEASWDTDDLSGELGVSMPPPNAGHPGMTVPDALGGEYHYNDAQVQVPLGQDSRADMVIVDPSQSQLRKTMDTLAASGVHDNHLHCTHQADQLIPWLRRFKPAVLILDETAHPLTSMVPKLNALRRTFDLEHIVLTVRSIPPEDSPFRAIDRERLLETIAASGVEVMTKPLNRIGLSKTIARYKAKTQMNYRLEQLAKEID